MAAHLFRVTRQVAPRRHFDPYSMIFYMRLKSHLAGYFTSWYIKTVQCLLWVCKIYAQTMLITLLTHPIDSLYTVESVKDTVPVIKHILGQKM